VGATVGHFQVYFLKQAYYRVRHGFISPTESVGACVYRRSAVLQDAEFGNDKGRNEPWMSTTITRPSARR
jgi:hypothetical protein